MSAPSYLDKREKSSTPLANRPLFDYNITDYMPVADETDRKKA
ncbi:hypothetical protein HMPREF0239_03388 [Clostridium sp. ATCC BAA-442]|uniref:Uncharacterized protein n=1 Tax=Flavonifractor plautii ATCC 29863 TaxID=411475 RepID=G9YR94_FLAPL|nr:hypothetical protein HMPREF0372_02039 [Flavonifractor plautii ATCC 29863]ERI71080.1 hypothetical protein HMPREF0239_03388 [Clostridium sp. ATCC BAA-442]